MPKLPTITPKKFIQVLTQLGFFYVRAKGSHQVYAHTDGRQTVVPMHGRDIPTGTLLAMLKDIQITKDEFLDLRK